MRAIHFLLTFIPFVSCAAAEIRSIAGTGLTGNRGDEGPATRAQLNQPFGLVRGPDDCLYFCDTGNHRIRKIDSKGVIHAVAGTGAAGWTGDGGPAIEAQLNEPYEVRFDADGNLFWVERLSHTVRRMDAKSGVVSTIAGAGVSGFGGDDGPATLAKLNQPHSIAFDSKGDLFICDIGNHRIRVVNMKTGFIRTFAGNGEKRTAPDGAGFSGAPMHGPRAIQFDSKGDLWVALREGNAIYRLETSSGTLHHVAGSGGKPALKGNGGPAKLAVLGGPKGIALAKNGDVYFTDTETHTIRYVNVKEGTVELAAGTGTKGNGPDGDPLHCGLARPHGVFIDRDGSIYIGDTDAHCIRVIR